MLRFQQRLTVKWLFLQVNANIKYKMCTGSQIILIVLYRENTVFLSHKKQLKN